MSKPGYEGVKTGVRECQIRGTRVSNLEYESIKSGGTRVSNWGIKSGVRGYRIWGTRVSNPGYEVIKSEAQGGTRVSNLGYEGIKSGVREEYERIKSGVRLHRLHRNIFVVYYNNKLL